MAKVRTYEDRISPSGTFTGPYYTEITERDGTKTSARGWTREQSRQNAEDRYDDKHRRK